MIPSPDGAAGSPKGLFALTEQQQRRMEEVREIARTELIPLAEEGDPGHVNRPMLEVMGQRGLLRGLFPVSSSG
ncbi:MAG: hypothetical protein HKL84_08020, partial [Acidimicrobiaceae bacterium]|nr:hypothetical protein [Acidimicrobiaceae bacterium]